MAIADLVSGKIAEPLGVRALVGDRAVEPADVLALAQRHDAHMVDLKFTDLPGTWQHMGMALESLDEEALTDGIGFDGSSIRGFQEIYESDMLLLPDRSTAVLDPFYEAPTISLVCTVLDPITRRPYTRDPRHVAMKAEEHLRATGIADVAYFGPEAEFYVFDHVAFDQQAHGGDVPPAAVGRERQRSGREREHHDPGHQRHAPAQPVSGATPDDAAGDRAHTGGQQHRRRVAEREVPFVGEVGYDEGDQEEVEQVEHGADHHCSREDPEAGTERRERPFRPGTGEQQRERRRSRGDERGNRAPLLGSLLIEPAGRRRAVLEQLVETPRRAVRIDDRGVGRAHARRDHRRPCRRHDGDITISA